MTPFPTPGYATLDRLSAEQGDSLYLFSPQVLRSNLDAFREAFTGHWAKTRLAYSYKTNYAPHLCHLLGQWGCMAEVVSGMEYELAKLIGVRGDDIIFNGPYKQAHEVKRALLDGAVVNVDSPCELDLIEQVSASHPHQSLKVGLRAAIEVEGRITRFGLDLENGDFHRAVDRLAELQNVAIVGFHVHQIPPGRTPRGYRLLADRLIDLFREYASRLPLEFLDMGGGFFSKMAPAMAEQFATDIPSFEEYGEAIGGAFQSAFAPDQGPLLILEPGMALVADAMQFVTRVIDLKTACGKTVALLSGSVYNVKPSKSPTNLPIRRVEGGRPAVEYDGIDLVGHTCMEDDVLYTNYRGPLAIGDFIVFENSGSYTLTLRPAFIQTAPPVFSVQTEEPPIPIRRAETVEDVFRTYQFPA